MDRVFDAKKFKNVKKRIEEIKKFYKHFSVYIVINLLFIGRRIYKDINNGDSITEAFTDLSNYKFFFWWGVGLIIHGVLVFGAPKIFSKDWEQRKIDELMKK